MTRGAVFTFDLFFAVVVENLVALAEFEPNSAILFVRAAVGQQLLLVAINRSRRAGSGGTGRCPRSPTLLGFDPVHRPQPRQTVVDELQERLAVHAWSVPNAQDERTAIVAGIEPVEQRGAGAADVEKPVGLAKRTRTLTWWKGQLETRERCQAEPSAINTKTPKPAREHGPRAPGRRANAGPPGPNHFVFSWAIPCI